jgi:hypothetical protein
MTLYGCFTFLIVMQVVWQSIKRGRAQDMFKCILGCGIGFFISCNYKLAYENISDVHANLTED